MPETIAEFPRDEFQQRRQQLTAVLLERETPAIVVTSPEDIYYLTGYNNQGHFAFTALVLAAGGPPVLVARRNGGPDRRGSGPRLWLRRVRRQRGSGGRSRRHDQAD
jgi:Xaa-Pro dipeptidase